MIHAAPLQVHPHLSDNGAHGHSTVRSLCYAVVWVAFASSGLVLVEPAPFDALSLGLVLLLPLVGLVEVTPALALYGCLWMVAIAAQLLGATLAPDTARAVLHTVISAQLVVVSVVIAGFVANNPTRHVRIVLSGWLVAACIAAVAAIIGYFGLIPGGEDLFTRYERGTGTFKDPNVFGPFLIAPILYALHVATTRSIGASLCALAAALVLSVGLFLSFSRGA